MAQTKAQLLGPVVGDVTIDTNTLSLDSESNKVGIGTASATTKLHVKDTFNTAYSLTNVADEANHILKLENASTTANAFSGMQFRVGSGADLFFGAIQQTVNHGDFFFSNQNSPQKEMMRIKSTGNVGIGTDNPATTLDVQGDMAVAYSATHALRFYNQPKSNWSSISNTDTGSNANLSFKSSQGEAMFITYDRKIGIGTDNPQNALHINGAAAAIRLSDTGANGSAFSIIEDNDGLLKVRNDAGNSGTGSGIAFEVDGSEKLRIDSSGRIGIGGNGVGSGLGVYLRRPSPNTTHFYEASDGTKKMITGVDSSNDYVKIGSLSNHRLGLVANNGERLSILPSGNIGINSTNPTSYGNSQKTLVIEDTTNPAICISDTGQTRDWWLIGFGDGLGVRYADGGGSGSASNVTSSMFFKNNGNVGIGNNDPTDKLSILATPNSLVIGCKDTTRSNHIFQLLADDGPGNGELRLYRNSASGTHEKTVEIASSGNSYINSDNSFGIGTSSPTNSHGKGLHVADSNAGIRIQNTVNTGWAYMEYADETNTVKYIQGYRDVTGLYGIRPGNSLNPNTGITLDSDGKVGINTTSPTTKLEVTGDVKVVNTGIAYLQPNTVTAFQAYESSGPVKISLNNNGSATFGGQVSVGGGLTSSVAVMNGQGAGGSAPVVTDTGISINQGGAGGALLLLASVNSSNATSTNSAVYLIRFFYDGNHVPSRYYITGSANFVSVSKSASNTLVLTSSAGGNVSYSWFGNKGSQFI